MSKIQKSIDFLLEIEQLKRVYRKARVKSDQNRRENSAEHSWHIAIAGQVLKDFCDFDVDINKVMQMLLIHDIVEIYTGDMPAYSDKALKDNHKIKEFQAMERLCSEFKLGQVNVFRELWQEFEAGVTNEAKFAMSVDRITPFIQNVHSEGGSWVESGATKAQILEHNKILQYVSAELWSYANTKIEFAVQQGWVRL
jgi:putative hydrolase of HD superfamily